MTILPWQAAFYRAVRLGGYPHLRVASAPIVLHPGRVPRTGGCLLAANHESPFDAALLMVATPRMIWWLSIVELFQHPFSRAFLSALGAMPLDRARPDPRTVRRVAGHLRGGRLVGIFPEGRLRTGTDSVLRGGTLDPGVARLAAMTRVPILPCVVLGGERFRRWQSWVPGARTPWVVAFGEPLEVPHLRKDKEAAARTTADGLARALRALEVEARAACPELERREA